MRIAFLGIDACPEPGLRRPFNFIGILDEEEQEAIALLQAEAEANADHIIWFGHYPTSCILSLQNKDGSKMSIRHTIGKSSASQVYLCGHLHTMGGLVKQMHTKHKRGYLELELSDWKDNRIFRVLVLDHGILSFVDQKHGEWPIVLVTNPKSARYVMPYREPLNLMMESSYVRIMAFSDQEIASVKMSFDNSSWVDCTHISGPLYVAKWKPALFNVGLHNLYINVVDVKKKESFIEHTFALDGTLVDFKITARILLMLDAGIVVSRYSYKYLLEIFMSFVDIPDSHVYLVEILFYYSTLYAVCI